MTPARILRAAQMLRDQADELARGHCIHSGDDFVWPADDDDSRARADHDEMIALAGELEELAAAPWLPQVRAVVAAHKGEANDG